MNNNMQEEVKALKEDMQNVLSRLNTLKGQSKEAMAEQFGELVNKMNEYKGQGYEKGKEYYHQMEDSMKNQPMLTALYAFGAGMALALLLKR